MQKEKTKCKFSIVSVKMLAFPSRLIDYDVKEDDDKEKDDKDDDGFNDQR